MAEYTVRAGDTLSSIGARNGVDWKQITGYRSGNPNLIYPGEVVRWGAPTPAPAPAAAAPAPTPEPDNVTPLFNELTQFDQNNKNPIDIYNAALEKLGISDARSRVTSLRQSLIDNQNLLDKLSGNVSGRTQDSLVNESQRQRLVATEAAPIVQMGENLNRIFNAAQGDYSTILGEAGKTTQIESDAATARRQALMDRLRIQIERTNDAEKKRQWQAEYDRQVALDKQNQANKDREFALAQQSAARAGSSGGGSSRSSGGSSSGGASLSLRKNSAGGYDVLDGGNVSQDYDLAGYARATGKNLIDLLKNGDAQDRQAAAWFEDNIRLGRGVDYAMDRLRNYDRPTAFFLGG